MIIYENNKKYFLKDVDAEKIANNLQHSFKAWGLGEVNDAEAASWKNSLRVMGRVIKEADIPDHVHIALEYIPRIGSERIDMMIMGEDLQSNKNFIIIELKQWDKISDTNHHDVVSVRFGKDKKEYLHPSYQAQWYLRMITDYNEDVRKYLNGKTVVYLHNADRKNNSNILNSKIYSCLDDTNIYFAGEEEKLRKLISKFTCNGKGKEILNIIENGKLSPSIKLMNLAKDMLCDNKTFFLMGKQKIILENILSKKDENNSVFIVSGNPGTGKSIIAMNLLSNLCNSKKLVHYVAPTTAFRNSLVKSLNCSVDVEKQVKHLFQGPSLTSRSNKDKFDWLIVDESHRLKGEGTKYYRGKSQIDDIVKAANNVVFFIDERQTIRSNDIGTINNIMVSCNKYNKNIFCGDQYHLDTQFRCLGGNNYIDAVLHCLQIEDTSSLYLNNNRKYDFKIFDDPNLLREKINARQKDGSKAVMLAGLGWKKSSNRLYKNWTNDSSCVIMTEYNFSMPWSPYNKKSVWLLENHSTSQIGCIHDVQGLEVDYAGVIIGNDLAIDDHGNLLAIRENYFDTVGKKGLESKKQLDDYIKNIYYILMTRGQKGTYLFIKNEKLREYFKKFISKVE